MKKKIRELGERSLAQAMKLLEKEGDLVVIDYFLDLGGEEMKAVECVNTNEKMEKLMTVAKCRKQSIELQKGLALLEQWSTLETDDEKSTFFAELDDKNKKLLDRTFWQGETGKAAALHLVKTAAVPTPKKAVASLAGGGLGALGAGVAGASTASTVLAGVGGALMVDVILTGLEEDEATKKVGRSLRSVLIDRPKGLIKSLFTKEGKTETKEALPKLEGPISGHGEILDNAKVKTAR
jgi:NADPH-dependent curcumin reductase CurA